MKYITVGQASQRSYLPTLDGWRALAIAIVILSHDQTHHIGRVSIGWFNGNGLIGVQIFFALSGILICTRLLMEEGATGTISLRKFYVRRIFRIQPASIVYLVAIALMMVTGVLAHAFSGIFYAVALVRNYFPLRPNPHDWYTGHFWSLSVEEHFYLILPGTLLTFKKYRARMMLALALILRGWETFLHRHPSWILGSVLALHTEVAIIGILIASAMAVAIRRPNVYEWSERLLNPYIVIPCAAAVTYLSSFNFSSVVDLAKLSLFPLMILSTMLRPSMLFSRLLESAPVRFFGRISYSLYLWQMLFFTTYWSIPVPASTFLAHLQSSWLRYPATLLMGVASYYLVEKPMVRIGHRLARSAVAGRDERLSERV